MNVKRKSSFIDALQDIIGCDTVESLYNKKISGKLHGSFVLFNDAPGNDILRLELYLIYYVENVNSLTNLEQFQDSVINCFHNIASTYLTYEEFDSYNNQTYKYNEKDIVHGLMRGYFELLDDTDNYLEHLNEFCSINCSNCNNRLSSVYFLLKYLDILNFYAHCETCYRLCKFLDGTILNNLLMVFSLTNNFLEKEMLFNRTFQLIVNIYWNVEVLMLTFSTNAAKLLVHNTSHFHLKNNEIYKEYSKDITLLLLPYTLSHYMLLDESIFKILADHVLGLSMHLIDNGYEIITSKYKRLMPFHAPFLSVVVNYAAFLLSGELKDLFNIPYANDIRKNFGYKNVNSVYKQWNVVISFIDYYISSLTLYLSSFDENKEKYYEYIIKSIIDPDLYKWLSSVQFNFNVSSQNKFKPRLSLFILYIIALYHRIPIIRVNDVTYLRLLYSLPWISALKFCVHDEVTSFMVPIFFKILIETFGNEILLNSIDYTHTSYILSQNLQRILKANTNFSCSYDTKSLKIMSFLSHSWHYINWDTISSGIIKNNNPWDLDNIYSTINNILPLIIKSPDFSEKEAVKIVNEDIASYNNIYYNWMNQYIWFAFGIDSGIAYLATVDTLIYCYILNYVNSIEGEGSKRNDLSRYDIASMTFSIINDTSQDNIQGIISSNHIALHQNPLNLLLHIPRKMILKLFNFRMFGNIYTILLSRLTKYIVEGSSSFHAATRTDIDTMTLSTLQDVSAINYVMDSCSIFHSSMVSNNIRSFISNLLSTNIYINDFIFSCGLPINRWNHLIYDTNQIEFIIMTITERYVHHVKMLMFNDNDYNAICKDDVYINKTNQDIQRSLDPFDSFDIPVFHLYVIHSLVFKLGREITLTESEINRSGIENSIKTVIAVFWDCVKSITKGSKIVKFIKNAMTIVIKFHYIYPVLCKNSIGIIKIHQHKPIGIINNIMYTSGEKTLEIMNSLANMQGIMKVIMEEDNKV